MGALSPRARASGPNGNAVSSVSVGIDVGGTYTDLVAVDREGSIESFKIPSTPRDQSEAVGDAVMWVRFLSRLKLGRCHASNQ